MYGHCATFVDDNGVIMMMLLYLDNIIVKIMV